MTSSRDLAKEVEEDGWRLDRSKGSHRVYVKDAQAPHGATDAHSPMC